MQEEEILNQEVTETLPKLETEVVKEPAQVSEIELPKVEQNLNCGCDNPNVTTVQLNEHEGIQECSNCLRFSKFPL